MSKSKQPDGLEPGIYFNLSNEAYHADPALGHSGMVNILDSWYDYWIDSPLNPDKTFKQSEAMLFGDRCHLLLLDEKAFFDTYYVTGSKYHPEKRLINRSDFEKIRESIQEIKNVPEAYAYFQNGMPEVSIFWRDIHTGIMLKIRVDYLRIFGGIDYKRARSLQNNTLGWQFVEYGYDIQQELYQQGILQAKKMLKKSLDFAKGDFDKGWVESFRKSPHNLFRFLFQRSERPYIFKFKAVDDEILANARSQIEQAKMTYKKSVEMYGTARPPAGTGETETISIYHMPRRIIDRGDHIYGN